MKKKKRKAEDFTDERQIPLTLPAEMMRYLEREAKKDGVDLTEYVMRMVAMDKARFEKR